MSKKAALRTLSMMFILLGCYFLIPESDNTCRQCDYYPKGSCPICSGRADGLSRADKQRNEMAPQMVKASALFVLGLGLGMISIRRETLAGS